MSDQQDQAPITELPETTEIPWSHFFTFGAGYDIVSGEVHTNSAITFVAPSEPSVFNEHTQFLYISSEEDFRREIGASIKGSGVVEGVNLEASASYLNKVQFSETSKTLIARYYGEYQDYSRISDRILSAQAARTGSDPEEFRTLYGDYFVNGVRHGFYFWAVFVIKASSVDSLNKFTASVGASAPDVFSASASASFEQAAKNSNVSITVDIIMSDHGAAPGEPTGDPSGNFTPASVVEALKWFKTAKKGTPIAAELVHYSSLIKDFPAFVPIGSKFFEQRADLERDLMLLTNKFQGLSVYESGKLQASYDRLTGKIDRERLEFYSRPELIMELISDVQQLSTEIDDLRQRLSIVRALRALQMGGDLETSTIAYSSVDIMPAIHVVKDTIVCSHEYAFGDTYTTITQNWNHPGRLLVGIQATPITDTDEGTATVPFSSMLTSSASVSVTSGFARGFSWTFDFLSVDISDLPLDAPI